MVMSIDTGQGLGERRPRDIIDGSGTQVGRLRSSVLRGPQIVIETDTAPSDIPPRSFSAALSSRPFEESSLVARQGTGLDHGTVHSSGIVVNGDCSPTSHVDGGAIRSRQNRPRVAHGCPHYS